jgi:crossover junction endodeoxyribonuclease RuvC
MTSPTPAADERRVRGDRKADSGRLVLGIDPGVASTGIGVVRERDRAYEAVHFELIRTKVGTPFPDRLAILNRRVAELVAEFKPAEVAMERLFFSRNVKTAIAVGQAQGAILLAMAGTGIPVFEYTPDQVKQSVTGDGRAEKSMVGEMTKKLLRLEEVPKPDDVADALAIAYCHLVSTRPGMAGRRG